jgi:hypothetical protein
MVTRHALGTHHSHQKGKPMITPPAPDQSPQPSLGGVAALIERAAAQGDDSFAFEVSQLLAAVAHAVNEGDALPLHQVEGHCHNIAYAWLLGRR